MQPLSLGDGIKYLRERRKMSARQVSISAGLSPSYVGKVEKNEIQPSITGFYHICQVIGASDKEIVFLLRLATNGNPS